MTSLPRTACAKLHKRKCSTLKIFLQQRSSRSMASSRQYLRPHAKRETVEPPTAPGSASNFTGLPEDDDAIPITTPVTSREMQEHIDLVCSEFKYVFKNILDKDHFEGKIYFRDPITNVSFFRGYQFVVQFLRFFLAPIYELHEVQQVGEQEILVKWSWTMNFWWNRYTPFKFFWDPRLAFTGITVLGYNPSSGKWNKHVDAWDSLRNNEFFSFEGFGFAFGQMFNVSTPPNRYTPEFQIYKKYKDFEIRRYRPFITASISLEDLSSSEDAVGGSSGTSTERELAQKQKAEALLERYLALGNERNEYFELTTPLFISQLGNLSLMVPGYKYLEDLPKPYKKHLVTLQEHPEQFYASVSFSGSPSEGDLQGKVEYLLDCIRKEGSEARDGSWVFARYNKEQLLSAKGPFRRNDLLVPLKEDSVDLWRGVDWDFIRRKVAHPV